MAENVPTAEEPLGPIAAPTGKAPCEPLQCGSRQVASTTRSLPHGPASVVVEGAPASNAITEGVEKTAALKPPRRPHRRTKLLLGQTSPQLGGGAASSATCTPSMISSASIRSKIRGS
jgi:hypothetical protein